MILAPTCGDLGGVRCTLKRHCRSLSRILRWFICDAYRSIATSGKIAAAGLFVGATLKLPLAQRDGGVLAALRLTCGALGLARFVAIDQHPVDLDRSLLCNRESGSGMRGSVRRPSGSQFLLREELRGHFVLPLPVRLLLRDTGRGLV